MATITVIEQPRQTVTVTVKGDKGDTGATGPAGADGRQGVDGEPGPAGTITVGTVTTGEAGTEVIIENTGTPSAAILDFTIPKGDTGEIPSIDGKVDKVSGLGILPLYHTLIIFDDIQYAPATTIAGWQAIEPNITISEVAIDGNDVNIYSASNINYWGISLKNNTHLIYFRSYSIFTLANQAFYGCVNLVQFDIIVDVLYIGDTSGNDGVFTGVTGLAEMTLPYNTSIADDGDPDGDLVYVLANNPGLYDITYTLSVADRLNGLETESESKANKVTSISSSSADYEYPSAKAVYDFTGATINELEIVYSFIADDTLLITGDGQITIHVTENLAGKNLIKANAAVSVASTSGVPTFNMRNATQGNVDLLTTPITIPINTFDSFAATQAVINPTYKLLTLGDRIQIDIDTAGTGTKGCQLILKVSNP